jgi:hypothetical protein
VQIFTSLPTTSGQKMLARFTRQAKILDVRSGGMYAVLIRSKLPTFRDSLSILSSKVKQSEKTSWTALRNKKTFQNKTHKIYLTTARLLVTNVCY